LADGNGLHGVERLSSAVHDVKADVGVVKQRRTALNRHAMGRLWAPSPLAFLLLLVLFLAHASQSELEKLDGVQEQTLAQRPTSIPKRGASSQRSQLMHRG